MLFRAHGNWRSRILFQSIRVNLEGFLYLDLSRLEENTVSSCVSVFLHLTELVYSDYVNNYGAVTLFYGHWKIKFKFPFCLLGKVVTAKCTQSLLINCLISP